MDKRLKVLILCNDFPPLNSIGARRPYSWWKYFKQYGLDTVIITKNWPENAASLNDVMMKIEATKPHPPIIEESEYGTLIRVQNKLGIYEKMLLYKKGAFWAFVRKCITMLSRLLLFSFPYFDQHWNIYREAQKFMVNNSVDVIITTGEPFILHKYGYLLKKKFKVKWIADYRDGWFFHHSTRFSRSPLVIFWRNWEKIFEKKYVSSADEITAAFPILCDELGIMFNKKVHLIINGYEEFAENKSTAKNGLPLTFSFGGNVVPDQKFDLFFEAIYQLKQQGLINKEDVLIKFIGGLLDARQNTLLTPYPQLLADVFIMTSRVTINEARQMCLEADYLLLFLIPGYKNIPSKLFEYLSLQRPILVIPNDNDVVQEIITNTKTGIFCSDVMAIKQFIMAQVNHKKGGNSLPATGITPELAFKYSRQYQAGLLADIVKAL